MLRKPAVARRVDELRAEFHQSCALSVERLQALLLPIVEANVLDLFEPSPVRERGGDGAQLEFNLRFKPLDRLTREQGLAVSALKLGEDGAVTDLKFHSKTDAARVLLATLGIRDSDENSGVALAELGARLGLALARANGKVIDGSSAPTALPSPRRGAADDEVVKW